MCLYDFNKSVACGVVATYLTTAVVVVACPALVNGSNTEPVDNSSLYEYQDTYTYICTAGYEHSGDLMTTCTAAGIWSLSPPSCTGVFYSLEF